MTAYLNVDSPDAKKLTFARTIQPEKKLDRPPNIVIVFMESFGAIKVGAYGNQLNPTPYFDAMAKESLLFKSFFVASKPTARSIFTVLTICGSIAIPIVAMVFVMRFIKKTVGPNRDVLQNGISAQAKIVSVQQTGVRLNDQPQILFDLEIRPPGGAPYRAQTKAVIPIIHIPQFQPGADVPVKIHPTDPAQVALDIYQ